MLSIQIEPIINTHLYVVGALLNARCTCPHVDATSLCMSYLCLLFPILYLFDSNFSDIVSIKLPPTL